MVVFYIYDNIMPNRASILPSVEIAYHRSHKMCGETLGWLTIERFKLIYTFDNDSLNS